MIFAIIVVTAFLMLSGLLSFVIGALNDNTFMAAVGMLAVVAGILSFAWIPALFG